MSDLDNAINSINASAAKAENTATFLDDMSTFDDQSSVTNPNNGQTVASIPKQVKDRTDELFTAAESDINQAVDDAAQSATDAQDAADSVGRYQGLWPDTGGSANKGDTYQTQVGGTPTGQYFTALQNTTVDPVGDDVNWRSLADHNSLINRDDPGAHPASAIDGAMWYVNVIKDLQGLVSTEGQQVSVTAYHDGWVALNSPPAGGGVFVFDENIQKSKHDGGNIINPNAPYPENWSDQAQLGGWYDYQDEGLGCWVRVGAEDKEALNFGAKGDGITVDTLAFKQIIKKYDDNRILARIGRGTFVIDDELVCEIGTRHSYIKGSGYSTSLLFHLPTSESFAITSSYPETGFADGTNNIVISDFMASCQNRVGKFLDTTGMVYSSISHVRATYFEKAIVFDRVWSFSMNNMKLWYNTITLSFDGADINKISMCDSQMYLSRKAVYGGAFSLSIDKSTIEKCDVVFGFDKDSGPSGPITLSDSYIEQCPVIIDMFKNYNTQVKIRDSFIHNYGTPDAELFEETDNCLIRFKGGVFNHQSTIELNNIKFAGAEYATGVFYSEAGTTIEPGMRIHVEKLQTQISSFTGVNESILPNDFYSFFVGAKPRFSQCYSDIPLLSLTEYINPSNSEVSKCTLRYITNPSKIDGSRLDNTCFVGCFGRVTVNSSTVISGIPTELRAVYNDASPVFILPNEVLSTAPLKYLRVRTNGEFWIRSQSGGTEYYGEVFDLKYLQYQIR